MQNWTAWLVGLNFFLVTVIIIVVVLSRRGENYEVGRNDDYRFFYYTDHAHYLCARKNSLHTFQEEHSNDFPKEWMDKYYLLNFKKCKALYKERKTKPFPFPTSYVENLYESWNQLDAKYKKDHRTIVWYPRDRVERFNYPVLVKSRMLASPEEGGHGSILFKLNTVRHFLRMEYVAKHRSKETEFRKKIPQLVWRGSPTGYGFKNNIPPRSVSRETLVQKFVNSTSPFINIGLVIKKEAHGDYKKYEKEEMSLDTLLKYKYLLSVEGNDVATNLKWIMASNSLVVMPKPQICSWMMEDSLVPYVHYLPVRDDFLDLESQIEWAERHTKKCEKMIANAHRYVEPFLDKIKEDKAQAKVLTYYLDHFEWKE